MQITLDILISCTCLWLSFEDFKDREISVWAIVLLGILVITTLFLEKGDVTKENIGFNLLFIAMQFLVLKMKIRRYKSKKTKSVFDEMGEGDWLVMIIFAFAFRYMNYFAFFLVSIMAYFLLTGINYIRKKAEGKSVPLAGILCMAFMIQVILKYSSPGISLLANNTGH